LTRSNWKESAEFVGILAIVLSLIFVGLQVKQSYEIAIASQYQARFDSLLTINSMRIESDVGLRVAGEGVLKFVKRQESIPINVLQRLESMSVEEVGYRFLIAQITLKQYDNLHYQYRSGFLDELSWQDFRSTLGEILLTEVEGAPSFARMLYESRDTGLHPAFRAEIVSILQEASSDSGS